jgi:hypothetical protein
MIQLSTPFFLMVMMSHSFVERDKTLHATVMVLSGLDHSIDQTNLPRRLPLLLTCSSGKPHTKSHKISLHALLKNSDLIHSQLDKNNAGASQNQTTSQLDVLMKDKNANAQVPYSLDQS